MIEGPLDGVENVCDTKVPTGFNTAILNFPFTALCLLAGQLCMFTYRNNFFYVRHTTLLVFRASTT